MNRRLRRAQQKREAQDARGALPRLQRALNAELDTVVRDTEDYVKHHITGEMYTAMAIVLRKHPYRWSADKTMRFLNIVGGIINQLNENNLTDYDLITEGEKYGIRVRWDANRKYVQEIGIFEEGEDGKEN